MIFSLTEEQKLMHKTHRAFAQTELLPEVIERDDSTQRSQRKSPKRHWRIRLLGH